MILWVEPDLGTVSGGLRYNQQARAALRQAGVPCETLSVAPQEFDAGTVAEARRRLQPELTVVDGLLGSAHPEVFTAGGPGAAALLVHMPAAAAQEVQGIGDAETAGNERWAVLEADHVVAVSRWAAAELRRRYRRREIAVAVPGTVAPLEAPALRGSGPARLAAVGALNPLKNHRLLVDALEPLKDLDWRLALAGPGESTAFGAELLAEMRDRLGDRLEWRGLLAPDEVAALWGETDLLVLPSLLETYGMAVTEACAHGVPALVSAGTGAEEAAGEAGLALDPRHPEEWTETLRRLITEEPGRERLREAALRRRAHLPSWAETASVFSGLG